jgi:hypothetical protein
MGVAVTYVVYLVISVALTVSVASALSRSGRIFLLDVFGGQAASAQAASRLLVVGFYLFNLGFVTLTMRMSGEIGSPRQAIQVLSVKVGEVLLVLGALYLANIGFLARFRRRVQTQAFEPVPPAAARPKPGPPHAGRPEPGLPETRLRETRLPEPGAPPEPAAATRPPAKAGPARSRDQGLWRPRPRQAIH